MVRLLHSWISWKCFAKRNKIHYPSVVLFLANENIDYDRQAIYYFKYFMERKYSHKGIIFWSYEESKQMLETVKVEQNIEIKYIHKKILKKYYQYYCFDKFYDNLVFTFVNIPESNQLSYVLNTSEVNEEDAVCLALYGLGKIP